MRLAVPLRDDRVRERSPHRLRPTPAEDSLSSRIPLDDPALGIYGNEGIVRRLQDSSELRLAPSELGGPRFHELLDRCGSTRDDEQEGTEKAREQQPERKHRPRVPTLVLE